MKTKTKVSKMKPVKFTEEDIKRMKRNEERALYFLKDLGTNKDDIARIYDEIMEDKNMQAIVAKDDIDCSYPVPLM